VIISVGIDIIEVYRIRQTIERTPRFVERVFTTLERDYCESKGVSRFASYAARFAAKEAALKALKTGWRGTISWHHLEILRNEFGVPEIEIYGEARKVFESLGANVAHLSMSHTSEHATATVILEKF
jgi:holo-[acyl-carrier protein] synthase